MLRSITLVTSLALVLSACGAQQDDDPLANTTEWPTTGPTEFDTSKIVPDGTKSAHSNVVKDIKTMSMPTDAFANENRINTSQALSAVVVKECGARNGVDTSSVTVNYNPNQAPKPYTNPSTGFQIFTKEAAQAIGYGLVYSIQDYQDTHDTEGMEAVYEQAMDNEGFQDCMEAAYTSKDGIIGEAGLDFGLMDFEEGKEPTIKETMLESPSLIPEMLAPHDVPAVKEAAARWKECMAPAGIADLPDTPSEMPPESILNELFEADTEGADQEGLKQKEIAVATIDAECRDSSGYARTFYDAQWVLVDDYVGKNLSELQKSYKNSQEAHAKMEDFIKEHQ